MTPQPVLKGLEPKAQPAARYAAIAVGIVCVAFAGVLARETWRVASHPAAQSWVEPITTTVAHSPLRPWMLAAGVGLILVGLIALLVALKPRKRTHHELAVEGAHTEQLSLWTRNVDIARHCSAIAQTTPGVKAARTLASRKTVDVIATGDVHDAELPSRIEAAIMHELAYLPQLPRLRVSIERDVEGLDTDD